MASQGASLTGYNTELVRLIEDLKGRKSGIDHELHELEQEKAKIQNDLQILQQRLHRIEESVKQKRQAGSEYDKTIQETESAYMRILESSQTLLKVLKRQSTSLGTK
ncbi:hypothetical protein KIPB_009150 [Kipferlia bialata]|uniref:Uncharacterized protein n=1 Tax=Kipferlia bialata TaxID=797122 RepID=A0A9K3GLA6_9EUKA|nr:hypothetical protein KIPB_009150 [Kipferlia bialata]|eukprot:g9150.t1